MKHLLNLLIASTALMNGTALGHDLLVGSYTDGASQGIYRYRFQDGQIDPHPVQVVTASNPSWLTLSADHRQLFVVNEQAAGQVSAFNLEAGSLINQVATQGSEPTHSSLSVLPVAVDGRLGEVVQQIRHAASKVDAERQSTPHVHSLVSSPDGRFVFASDLGADRVFSYRYQQSPQPLTAFDSIALPPGSGPRHLLFGADGRHAYLTLEMSAEVAVFDYRDGRLVPVQRLPLTDSDSPAAKAGGAVHGSADGRFLYVSNRGTANELVVFAIDPQSGVLTLVQRRSVEGDHPREFALDPDGKFVLVANQKSNEIVVIRRDPESGKLGETLQTLSQPSPSDLTFID